MKSKKNKKKIIYFLISLLAISLIVIAFPYPPKTVEKNGGLVFDIEITSLHPTAKQIDTTLKILGKRVSSVCNHDPSVKLSADKKHIQINLPLAKDPKLYKDFVLIKGNLEAFETYNNLKIYPYLNKINGKMVDDQLRKSQNYSIIENKKIPALVQILYSYVDNENTLINGPIIGTSKVSDTALVDEIILRSKFSKLFPKDFRAKWIKGYESDNIYYLMALKVPPQNEKIESNMILNAKVEKYNNGKYDEVFINLKRNYFKNWSNLTRKMIGKQIPIVFNNKIITHPVVQSAITVGKLSIVTKNENQATALAATLNTGIIPIDFKVAGVNIVNKPK